jgi:predicted dehydrogenase
LDKRVTGSRIFRQGRAFSYLEDEDRFLTGTEAPEFSYGYIGCGMMGLEHMRNTLLVGRASIGGIYDPSEKSLRHALQSLGKRLEGASPRVYDSLEEACADPDTDALIIATPNYTHLDVMRVATRYDKAIFLEKPIATTVEDAYEVCRLSAGHEKPVRLGLQYRYKAIYAEAIAEVFDRGAVGSVHSINMLEHRFPFLDKVGQWNKFNRYTGGALVEKCCHYFDLINLFAGGRPERVYAIGSQAVNFTEFTYDNRRADGLDQAQVTISYDNGVIGSFSLCMFVPGAREELIVCGDAGRLRASEQSLLGEENQNDLEVWSGENAASRTSAPAYPSYIARAGHHGSTFFEHIAFAEDLSDDTAQGPSLADGFWSVVVGAAAQRSIEQGEAVTVADILPDNFDASALERR